MSLSIVLFSNSSLYCMDNEIKAQNSFLGKKNAEFHHNVSFHPSEVVSESEFYNNEFEFHIKYYSKIIDDKDICKCIDCAVFKYKEFVNANNKLREIIKNENNNSKTDEYHTILQNLSSKEFPILTLTQDDFEIIKENYYNVQKNQSDSLNIKYYNAEDKKRF